MNWKAVSALSFVILLLVGSAGVIRDWRVDSDFPSIQAKSDEAAVRQLMGEPRQILPSCVAYDVTVTPDCDHVFVYRSIFYPVRNRYWLVFFDKNKEVTATSSELEP